MWKSQKGQSSLEAVFCIGTIIIPLGAGLWIWAHLEFKKSEQAFMGFQKARIQLIHTQKPVQTETFLLQPLESLDRSKGGLLPASDLKEVLQLWDFRFFFSPSSLPSEGGSSSEK